MIKPLRTIHFITWRILAVVLPVTFVLAILWNPAEKKIQRDHAREVQIKPDETIINPDSIK